MSTIYNCVHYAKHKSIAMFYVSVIDQVIQKYFDYYKWFNYVEFLRLFTRTTMLSLESRCNLRRYS